MSVDLRPSQALGLWHAATLEHVRLIGPDLTIRQLAILLHIYLAAPPHTVRGLAAMLGVTKPVITRALDTMGHMGLVRRVRDERDRRNVVIKRTVEGALFVEKLGDIIIMEGRRLTAAEPQNSMTNTLDRRQHAYRPDLADIRLQDKVAAERYTQGMAAEIVVPLAKLHPRPDPDCAIDTEALFGETLRVFDRKDGWAWVQLDADGYVGYLRENVIADRSSGATHLVCVPRTFVYSGADLRFRVVHALSMASRVNVTGTAETRGTSYALMGDGTAMIAAHLRPLAEVASQDAVAVAVMFLETPYLWGGRSGFGIDCSGLVQMALAMTGKPAPRDSDQQGQGLGRSIDPVQDGLSRGDLVFWKGHVGFLEDPHTLLHASGGTMSVTREPLQAAIERIAPLYGQPTGYCRP